MEERIGSFRDSLLAWYRAQGRHFRWREDSDPYHVLIAERMLHRTGARQVVPVYEAFLSHYPTVNDLAAAALSDVSALLAPLGLGWRLASFVPMAQRIVDDHDGHVPKARDELLALPGVGPYVASAVLCFAYHEPVAVVDTNTIRVAGRYLTGIAWTGDQRKRRDVRASVARLMDPQHPAETNYGMLDLGAMICVARDPLCSCCPVVAGCILGLQRQETEVSAEVGRPAAPLTTSVIGRMIRVQP